MATDVVTRDDEADGEDSGLHERQVAALEKLHELGALPRRPGEKYSPDRRVRMQQLMYEGRIGGPQPGSGRPRQPRSSELVAAYVRETLTPKIQRALRDGLSVGEDINVRLKAADQALKIEREEAALQLREDQADLDNADKGELIAALFAIANDPATEAALEAIIELPDSAVTDITDDDGSTGTGTTFVPEEVGSDESEAGSNGRGHTERSGPERPNPFTEIARRRAADRRRAS
jgi:hypothetical protein